MKRSTPYIFLLLLLLIVALVLTAAHLAQKDGASPPPTSWLPPRLTPDPSVTTRAPGWWSQLPTPIPLPSITPGE
jgi:hypothetical protein